MFCLAYIIFLKDRKATTIDSLVKDINQFSSTLKNDQVKFRMALGMVGVSASRNDVIKKSEPLVNTLCFFCRFLCLVLLDLLRFL